MSGKFGRNETKCKRYRANGTRELNKARKTKKESIRQARLMARTDQKDATDSAMKKRTSRRNKARVTDDLAIDLSGIKPTS